MDGLFAKKEKLKHIRKKIELMSDNKKKSELIDSYISLLVYLKHVGEIEQHELNSFYLYDEDTKKYDERIVKETERKIQELYNSASYLKRVCQKIIDEYKKEDFCSFEYTIYNKVNIQEMSELINQFFEFLGNDVYKLFHDMSCNDNISMLNDCDDSLGFSINSLAIDNPSIILQDIDYNLDFYFTLAHEMGHCYQFYLQRNQLNIGSFNIFDEVTSLLFEKLFREFLFSKKIYNKDVYAYDLESHLYFLNDASVTKVLCELLENDEIVSINPFNMKYVTNVPYKELFKKVIGDCGYLFPNKIDFEFDEIQYFVGDVIASYFVRKMKNDFKIGWKEFKDFICQANYLPLDEVLKEYLDVDLVNDNTKKFIKSYRGR